MAQRTRLLTLTITLVTTLVPHAAFAQRGQESQRGDRGPQQDLPRFLDAEAIEALELDEGQEQVLDELQAELRADLSMMNEDIDDIRSQLEELWAFDSPDKEAILALGEWVDVMMASVREREVEFRLDVLEILRPDQRALLAELTLAEDQGRQGQTRRGASAAFRPNRSEDQGWNQEAEDFDQDQDAEDFAWGNVRESEEDEAQNRRGGRGQSHRGGLVEQLDLDGWQRAEVSALQDELREQSSPILQLRGELQREMRELWATGWPDVDAIYEVGEDLDNLRGLLRVQQVDFRAAVIALLTPEQRSLYAELSEAELRPSRQQGEGRRGTVRPMNELGRSTRLWGRDQQMGSDTVM